MIQREDGGLEPVEEKKQPNHLTDMSYWGERDPLLEEVVCLDCGGADNEDELLICDAGCGRAQHTYCAELSEIPSGAWYCPPCALMGASQGAEPVDSPVPREEAACQRRLLQQLRSGGRASTGGGSDTSEDGSPAVGHFSFEQRRRKKKPGRRAAIVIDSDSE